MCRVCLRVSLSDDHHLPRLVRKLSLRRPPPLPSSVTTAHLANYGFHLSSTPCNSASVFLVSGLSFLYIFWSLSLLPSNCSQHDVCIRSRGSRPNDGHCRYFLCHQWWSLGSSDLEHSSRPRKINFRNTENAFAAKAPMLQTSMFPISPYFTLSRPPAPLSNSVPPPRFKGMLTITGLVQYCTNATIRHETRLRLSYRGEFNATPQRYCDYH